jgi:hypothetical protein
MASPVSFAHEARGTLSCRRPKPVKKLGKKARAAAAARGTKEVAANRLDAPPESNASSGRGRIPAAAARPGANDGANDDMVTRKQKKALIEVKGRMGELEPWQEKVFQDEALPQYSRFIRDYRSSTGAVDVDFESLKNYLSFYGPKALPGKGDEPVILIYLLPGGDECGEKCAAATPALRKLVAARVARRGLKAAWLSAGEFGSVSSKLAGSLKDKALDEKLASLVKTRAAGGGLLLQWDQIPQDPDDAHGDEKRFTLRAHLEVPGLAYKGDGRMELLENDAFEPAAARLLTDITAELGARAVVAERSSNARGNGGAVEPAAGVELDAPEVRVTLNDVRDFAALSLTKTELQAKFPQASVQERTVARGTAELAIVGERSPENVRRGLAGVTGRPQLSAVQPEPSALSVPAAAAVPSAQGALQ